VVSNPFPLYPGLKIVLPPAYFGGIGRFAAIAAAGKTAIDPTLRFNKRQKWVHRCDIADTRGTVQLTVPIVKPESSHTALWSDILISDHGGWWHIHWTTLESAYGRTPFFEFYADRFAPFFRHCPEGRLTDFTTALDAVILNILGLPQLTAPDVTYAAARTDYAPLPYWQVRADRLGFIPGLSILDLIFNLGPEAPLHLLALNRNSAY